MRTVEWANNVKLLGRLYAARLGMRGVIYIFFMGLAAFLGLIKTMVYGMYISPREMGYLSIALTIASYGVLLQLGVMNGLNRELPVALGAGRVGQTSRLVGDTTIAVLLFQVAGLILYFTIVSQVGFSDSSTKTAFMLGAFLAFFATFGQIVILRLRAEQRVVGFATLQLLNAASILLLGVLAIIYLSYIGAILAQIFINLVGFLVVSLWFLPPVDYRHFTTKNVRYLMQVGLPLLGAGVLLNLQLSMDRLFMIKSLSTEDIGIYQIGTLPLTMAIVLNSLVSQYVGPLLLYRYGQGQPLSYIFKRSIQVSLVLIAVMAAAWPLFYMLVGTAIDLWLPKYQSSVPIISIFYLGAIFTSADSGVVINAANRQILSFYTYAFVLLTCFIGYIFVAYTAKPIKWYAYINTVGQMLNFLSNTSLSYYLVRRGANCSIA